MQGALLAHASRVGGEEKRGAAGNSSAVATRRSGPCYRLASAQGELVAETAKAKDHDQAQAGTLREATVGQITGLLPELQPRVIRFR